MDIIKEINTILKEKNINIKLTSSNIKETFKDLGIDSLASMTVIIAIEEKFNIQVDDETLMNIKTPEDLIKGLEPLIKK